MKAGIVAFPASYSLPARPHEQSSAGAYKQTTFLLKDDLALFGRLMNAQLSIVAANKRPLSAEATAVLSLWSRVYSSLEDACALTLAGSYGSSMPILRAACDCLAVQRSLVRDGFAEYRVWFERALSQDRERAALAYDIGRNRAGSVYAEDRALGTIFRAVSELSMPHFGSTALLTAPDSSLQKLSLAFADRAFHYGWSELALGWCLHLAAAQTSLVLECGVLGVPGEVASEARGLTLAAAAALQRSGRCRVEDAGGALVFHAFRRTPGAQPRRVVLG